MQQISEKQLPQATRVEQRETGNVLFTLVSWLFLIGSLIFQVDAVLEVTESVSMHAVLHLLASCLFTVGSVLFVIHDARQG
jgi:hypothetical protein